MAKLIINTGDWSDETEGAGTFLSCRVTFGPTRLIAYALRVDNRPDDEKQAETEGWPKDGDDCEPEYYQRAADESYATTYSDLLDLVNDSAKLNTVKIPDFDGEYVVWLEP